MKRCLVLTGALLTCSFLVGCGSDSREGLVDETIQMIDQASTQIGNINARVKEATKKAEEKKTKLDLADATKAAEQLRKYGEEEAQKIKRHIELYRSSITEEDRKAYAEKKHNRLVEAYAELAKKQAELNKSLAKAEELNQAAKNAVEDFRAKWREAQGPFESLAR